jgi:hypothetical protein
MAGCRERWSAYLKNSRKLSALAKVRPILAPVKDLDDQGMAGHPRAAGKKKPAALGQRVIVLTVFGGEP